MKFVSISEALPDANQRVVLRCESFRCLGYLDRDGVWRDGKDNPVDENVVEWAEIPGWMHQLSENPAATLVRPGK